mmetsp:Transcript_3643/g.13377  ORF Transcript_3643/g.13377 Transcript_3643/m.13377 type:complete len:227 (-) Transcript_3643:4834-5514(-)
MSEADFVAVAHGHVRGRGVGHVEVDGLLHGIHRLNFPIVLGEAIDVVRSRLQQEVCAQTSVLCQLVNLNIDVNVWHVHVLHEGGTPSLDVADVGGSGDVVDGHVRRGVRGRNVRHCRMAPNCTWLGKLQGDLDDALGKRLARDEDDGGRSHVLDPDVLAPAALRRGDRVCVGLEVILDDIVGPCHALSVDGAIFGPAVDVVLSGLVQHLVVTGLKLVDGNVARGSW